MSIVSFSCRISEFRMVQVSQLGGLKSCCWSSVNTSLRCWTCIGKIWKITNTTTEKHMENNYTYHNININQLNDTTAKKVYYSGMC